MKKFLTGAFCMAIVTAVAYFIILVFKKKQLEEIASKNVNVLAEQLREPIKSIQEREEKVTEEIQKVLAYQAEEIQDAWKAKFGG